jgi:D-3-phosphoglycerate dehydrogenase
MNILLLENIHTDAVTLFRNVGYKVETRPASLTEDALCDAIRDVYVLGIRSKTQITKKIIANAKNLWAIGAYCIGTNQIDLDACLDYGVSVFNAPYSNTRSVVELAMGEMIALSRRMVVSNQAMHQGRWQKSAAGCYELRGKKLGIIGYGNIGSQLSVLAEAFGMNVIYYDRSEKLAIGNAVKCHSMKELLEQADIVSLHVDGDAGNHHLIHGDSLARMKKGAILLNLSRGSVVDLEALKAALLSEHLAGAAIDVFPEEPHANGDGFYSPLQGLDNVILTSHIGGSTEEAQVSIAQFVPARIIDYMNTGNTQMSVNFPALQLTHFNNSHRFIHIHHNKAGVLAAINELFAKHKINIVGQYLKTNEKIGYVITDVEFGYDDSLLEEITQIPHTIRFRVVY